jgi:acetyl esterase/lipase
MPNLLPSSWWWFQYCFLLIPIRILFGIILPPILQYFWHNGSVFHLAQDDQPVYQHVQVVGVDIPYGTNPRETMDVLIPAPNKENLGGDGKTYQQRSYAIFISIIDLITAYPRAFISWLIKKPGFVPPELEKAQHFKPILFLHGGGMCCVDPCIQHHQLTAFVRKGFSIYSLAYPHAPEDQYPTQIISTLKALCWLKTFHGHQQVAIIGESAGGTLASCSVALLSSRSALEGFAHALVERHGISNGLDILSWDFPKVTSVVTWYGILDSESWKRQGILWWGLNFTQQCYLGLCPFPLLWTSVPSTARDDRHECEFKDLVSMLQTNLIKEFPPYLIISGTVDPLGLAHSSRLAEQVLKEKLHPHCRGNIRLSEYEASHAFIGLNPFVLWLFQGSKWREYALPATNETATFIIQHYNSPYDGGKNSNGKNNNGNKIMQ